MDMSPKVQAMQARLDLIAGERRRLHAAHLKQEPISDSRAERNRRARVEAESYARTVADWQRIMAREMAGMRNSFIQGISQQNAANQSNQQSAYQVLQAQQAAGSRLYWGMNCHD